MKVAVVMGSKSDLPVMQDVFFERVEKYRKENGIS